MRKASMRILGAAALPILTFCAACQGDSVFNEVGAGGGGATATGTGGASGGAGEGGEPRGCMPGTTMDCYSGPPGTQGVGPCAAGVAICQPDGRYGSCMGEVLPAAEQCATSADEDCNGVSETCTPGQPVWAKKFADPNPGSATGGEGLSIAADASANVLVAGRAESSIDFGGGPLLPLGGTDVVLAKLDPAGNHLWSKRFGGMSYDVGHDVAVDASGNVWLTGEFMQTIDFGGDALQGGGVFLAKFDPQGNHVWSGAFGDPSGHGIALAVDGNGAAIVTGYFMGTIDFGGGALTSVGSNDVFVAKLSAQGAHVWSKRFGDNYNQGPFDVAVDSTGNVVLSTYYDGAPDFGGGAMTFTNNGLALVKLSASGTHVASANFGGGNSFVSPVAIAIDPNDNLTLLGGLYGSVSFGGAALASAGFDDTFVAQLTASGSHLWSARYGDAQSQQSGWGAAADAAGNALVCGFLSGSMSFGGSTLTSAGLEDVFLAKLSPTGSHIFSTRAGSATSQICWAVDADPTGYMLATGRFAGTLDFGTVPPITANSNGTDIFVVKLQP